MHVLSTIPLLLGSDNLIRCKQFDMIAILYHIMKWIISIAFTLLGLSVFLSIQLFKLQIFIAYAYMSIHCCTQLANCICIILCNIAMLLLLQCVCVSWLLVVWLLLFSLSNSYINMARMGERSFVLTYAFAFLTPAGIWCRCAYSSINLFIPLLIFT